MKPRINAPRIEDIDPSILREALTYNPETGDIFFKHRDLHLFAVCADREQVAKRWNDRFAGTAALQSVGRDGYRYGEVLGRKLRAHRVAVALITGAWPRDEVDHVNHHKADNRWINLREVSKTENGRNVPRNSKNTSGHTGVCWCRLRNKWQANIKVDGRKLNLGRFNDISDAIAARAAASQKYGFHENHGASQ